MAHFSKETYAKKKEWAASRMVKNAEVSSLSEEQHRVLAHICTIRHEIHCDVESLMFSESANYTEYTNFVPNVWGESDECIKNILCDAELPEIKIIELNGYNFWDDGVPDETQTKFLREHYQEQDLIDNIEEINLLDDNEIHDKVLGICEQTLSEIDQQIRNYLAYIDHVYGTDYAPLGGNCVEYLND